MFCAAVMVVGVGRDPALIRMVPNTHTNTHSLSLSLPIYLSHSHVFSLVLPIFQSSLNFSPFTGADQRCTPPCLLLVPTSLPCCCLITVSKQGFCPQQSSIKCLLLIRRWIIVLGGFFPSSLSSPFSAQATFSQVFCRRHQGIMLKKPEGKFPFSCLLFSTSYFN